MFPLVFIYFNIFKIQFTILTIKKGKNCTELPKISKILLRQIKVRIFPFFQFSLNSILTQKPQNIISLNRFRS